jgi:hypothetical protein
MALDLEAIKGREAAATPGPWAVPGANVFRVIAPEAEHHNPRMGECPPYPWRGQGTQRCLDCLYAWGRGRKPVCDRCTEAYARLESLGFGERMREWDS